MRKSFVVLMVLGFFLESGFSQVPFRDVERKPDTAFMLAMTAYNAALIADTATTLTLLRRRDCQEGNPLLAPFADEPRSLAAVRLAAGAGANLALLRLTESREEGTRPALKLPANPNVRTLLENREWTLTSWASSSILPAATSGPRFVGARPPAEEGDASACVPATMAAIQT